MNIETMNMSELKELRSKIGARLNDLDGESELPNDVDELSGMLDKIDARESDLTKAAEKRAAAIQRLSNMPGKAVNAKEEKPKDIRASVEYGKAFLRALQTGDQKECRSLLSTNGTSVTLSLTGYVPVPTFLESEIKTAWEECKLLSMVKHSFFKGNVKIGFELSATGANVHLEGDEEPDEEVITIGTVEIKANNIKKWITVSDEALEGTTVDTMGYLFKEIAQKIVECAEGILLGLIENAPTSATSSAVAVAEVEVTTLDVDTITTAAAEVSGQAKNLTAVMNRRTYAALKAAAKKSYYGVDPFDGIPVVFSDQLTAIGDAEEDDMLIVIGDFAYGAQANFPNGDTVMMKVDDNSLAEQDLVKIVGRQYVGMALVANKAFVRVVMGDTTP